MGEVVHEEEAVLVDEVVDEVVEEVVDFLADVVVRGAAVLEIVVGVEGASVVVGDEDLEALDVMVSPVYIFFLF